jgi:hypothetical protein
MELRALTYTSSIIEAVSRRNVDGTAKHACPPIRVTPGYVLDQSARLYLTGHTVRHSLTGGEAKLAYSSTIAMI